MPGHSQKRDGLSPIPTDHRDGLGNALRPPLRLGAIAGWGTSRTVNKPSSGEPCGGLARMNGIPRSRFSRRDCAHRGKAIATLVISEQNCSVLFLRCFYAARKIPEFSGFVKESRDGAVSKDHSGRHGRGGLELAPGPGGFKTRPTRRGFRHGARSAFCAPARRWRPGRRHAPRTGRISLSRDGQTHLAGVLRSRRQAQRNALSRRAHAPADAIRASWSSCAW